MRARSFFLSLGCALLLALPVVSQGIPTGTLSGHLSSTDKAALPGVTVTVTSPALQGTRTTVTNGNGDYLLALLPPGDYKLSFEIEGFKKAERSATVAATQTATVNVDMTLSGVEETIVVTGASETISATPEASTTYSQKLINELPVSRNIRDTVLLTPGTNANGPNSAITISGAQSFENLFLVNGVEVQDNIRGTPFNLFIEDAIQETTTSTSAISAEYGHFQGGVVNVITKSGGNEVHGTFRTTMTNADWAERISKLNNSRDNTTDPTYEGTLGGWFLKDRIWYFGAGRNFSLDGSAQTALTNITIPQTTKETRGEGKLTISPLEGQRLIGSYTKISHTEDGNFFTSIPVLDLASTYNRELPQELVAGNYNGVFAENFFVEGQYSRRKFSFVGSGGQFRDLIRGTVIADNSTGFRYNAPTFCGVCKPELRNNNEIQAKGSWFTSSSGFGSHDLTAGYDRYDDIRQADNHQSGSDFVLTASSTIIHGTNAAPVFRGDGTSAFITWFPIAVSSKGTALYSDAFYANDRWRLNEHFSFNLGVRYDKNNGQNSQGATVANDSKVSPRIAAAYDVKADGDWIVNASFGTYVAAIANTQADATSAAGNPSQYVFAYKGPNINTDGSLTSAQAIAQLFSWFNSLGGVNNLSLLAQNPNIPGGTTIIPGSLKSPSTDEYAIGFTKRLSNRGLWRTGYVHRQGSDFYSRLITLQTGHTLTPTGAPADLGFQTNDNGFLKRKYDAINTQAQYRLFDRLSLGLNYTLSWLRGNFDGETAGSGPVASNWDQYPEYKQTSWNIPNGYLGIDQRHRLQAFGVYDIMRNSRNDLSASLIQTYASGTPYGAVGAIADRSFVTNPGYIRPPTTVTYFYTGRAAFRTPNISSTDIAFNYGFHLPLMTKDVELFVSPQILNVFNQQNALTVNTSIQDSTNNPNLKPFNPFTTKPVEGVNWVKGPNFGKPVVLGDFQTPRTFRFSVGLRF